MFHYNNLKILENLSGGIDLIYDDGKVMEHIEFRITADLFEKLEKLAYSQNVCLTNILIAALTLLLSRLTRRKKIVIGYQAQKRVLQSTISRILQTDFSMDCEFMNIVVQQIKNLSKNNQTRLPGIRFIESCLNGENKQVPFSFAYNVQRSRVLGITYNSFLFEEDFIRQFFKMFNILLNGVVSNPNGRISALPIATEEEIDTQLVKWNQNANDFPKDETIQQLFEQQVELYPHNVAVVYKNERLTYGELNARANQLAYYLRDQYQQLTGRLFRPDTFVGLCLERGLEIIVGILGILKAGGAYVPMDPDYPEERLLFMLNDASIKLVVSQKSVVKKFSFLSSNGKIKIICLDAQRREIKNLSVKNIPGINKVTDLAYLIYTSGTTGKPKGVMIEHRGIPNLSYNIMKIAQVNPSTRGLLFASINFDASVADIFPILMKGAALYILPNEERKDSELLFQYLLHNRITLAALTPVVLESLPWLPLPHLKSLMVVGDSCKKEAVEYWSQDRRLINGYGPTEATVGSNYSIYDAGKSATQIGKPISNVTNYILDSNLQHMPIGIPGELYIGGIGLAREYLNSPRLTSEKFIFNPFGKGRLYKTGDLARWLSIGEIEFIGRVDLQVKVGGIRIEPGEIEACIASYESVKQCVVEVKEHNKDKTLVAYVVPEKGFTFSTKELIAYLKKKLPRYMLPAAFVSLRSFPITPNAKIDREALPMPQDTECSNDETYVAPKTEIESQLVQIWSEYLPFKRQIGIEDDFFLIGGDSILAIRVIAESRKRGLSFTISELFQYPTIERLARHVERADGEPAQLDNLSEKTSEVMSTPMHRRFFEKKRSNRNFCNPPILMNVKQPIACSCKEETFQIPLKCKDTPWLRFKYNRIIKNCNLKTKTSSLSQMKSEELADKDFSYEKYMNEDFALLPIQDKGTKIPLFLIHSAWGISLGYANLASYFEGQPLYSINNPLFFTPTVLFENVEEMAESYINFIQKIQKHGPYRLGGWCAGGLISFEIARQLEQRGEKVELVILISSNATYEFYLQEIPYSFMQQFFTRNNIRDRDFQLCLQFSCLYIGGICFRYSSKLKTSLKMGRLRPYSGRVVLIRPQDIEKNEFPLNPAIGGKYAGWELFVESKQFQIYDSSGSHFTLFEPNIIQKLSKLILGLL